MKRCLHQIIRPRRKCLNDIDGVGECVECECDEKENKKCIKYTPVNIIIEDIKDGPNN